MTNSRTIGSGHATCIRFSRKGDFLASGRVSPNLIPLTEAKLDDPQQVDGTIVVFDVETNGVARKLRGHTRQIQSLRCDRSAVLTYQTFQ